MTLSKRQLKILASNAWVECEMEQTSKVIVIKGDSDKIYNTLNEFADEMNERDDNRDYTADVECFGDEFRFSVSENERRVPCYEYDPDEEEEDEVAESAILLKSSNPAPDDVEWNKIRDVLLQADVCGEFFTNDHLALALNYGNCLNEGRHPKTIDDDWYLFKNITLPFRGSDQDTCYQIYRRLDAERIAIYWSLMNHS